MKHPLIVSLLATALIGAAAAQAPALVISSNPNATDAQKFLLVNQYRAPATEWILAVHFNLPNGQARTVIQHRWGFPATGKQQPIAPGSYIKVGAPPGAQVVCEAVIYDDGQTYGSQLLINTMVQGRKEMLADLQTAVALLQAGAGSSATNWTAVAADFQQRSNTAHANAIAFYHAEGGDGAAPVSADRVWDPMVQDMNAEIKAGTPAAEMATHYAHLANFYNGWVGQLQGSLPALQ